MKKLFTLFLCLTLILLSSCSEALQNEANLNVDDAALNPSNNTPNAQNQQSGNYEVADEDRNDSIGLYTYEEYTQYMATHDVPDHFIPYEDLTAFGDFDALLMFIENALYQSYAYTFTYGEQKWSLHIYHNNDPEYRYKPDMNKLSTYDPQDSDMRYYPGIGNLYCKYENIRFYYSNDKLTDVHWVSHDVGFWLRGDYKLGELYEYHGDNVPINMLLNKESVAEFKAMCDDYVAKKMGVK